MSREGHRKIAEKVRFREHLRFTKKLTDLPGSMNRLNKTRMRLKTGTRIAYAPATRSIATRR